MIRSVFLRTLAVSISALSAQLCGCAAMAPKELQGLEIAKATTPELLEQASWARLNVYRDSQNQLFAVRTELASRLTPPPTEEHRKAVADGKIMVGMTRQMVLYAWGEPYQKWTQKSTSGDQEIWTYGAGSYTRSVYFSGDLVIWAGSTTYR